MVVVKRQLSLFGHTFSYYVRLQPERQRLAYGVGNRCNDGLYVLFLDYDGVPLSWIHDEIALLQRLRVVGDAFLFETKHGHHVVFLEKMPLDELTDVLRMTSCDKNYQVVPMEYARKIWVLRQSPKNNEIMKYLGVRKTQESLFVSRSYAHALYLCNIMHVPSEDLRLSPKIFYDEEKELYVGYYKVVDQ